MNTSFVSGLSLELDIFSVSAIKGEISDFMEELFLFERIPAKLKILKRGGVVADQINGTDEATH